MTSPRPWRWLPAAAQRPAANMAIDEAIFRRRPIRPTLRFYRWEPPGLSLGYFQAADAGEIARFRAAGFEVVRRMTGGGAIAHAGELTFSIALPAGDPSLPGGLVASYEAIHGGLIEALADVGVRAALRGRGDADETPFLCFHRATGFDLVARGRKLVGSAQRRSRGAFLQHGSIPVEPNRWTPEATSVREEAGRDVGYNELERAIVDRLGARLGVTLDPGDLDGEERSLAAELEEARYATDAWTLRRA